MPVDEGNIIHSEVFAATNWASADFSLSGLANRPRGVPRRLHVHNSDSSAQNLVVVTPGGVRREFSIAPGAHPYPIDLIAEAISFDSGADLTVTAEWVNPGGDGTGFISHPSQVEGLRAWFGDTVTGAGTAGFNVRDLSGNGNHGTQATTLNQPTSSGGVLNFAAASSQHFDVASASLGLSGSTAYALIWRSTLSEDAPSAIRKLITNQSESALRMEFNQTSGDLALGKANDASNRLTVAGTVADWTVEHSFAFVVNGTAASLRLDGAQVGSATFVQSAVPTFSDAINIGGVNFHFDGSMREFFIITGRVPTTAELEYLENYGV